MNEQILINYTKAENGDFFVSIISGNKNRFIDNEEEATPIINDLKNIIERI
jgi:hypothetical protein